MKEFSLMLIALIIFFSGCISSGNEKGSAIDISEMAKTKCIELCRDAAAKNVRLDNGPCLSDNNPEWDIDGWVCDVAHWPREDVDNLRENQCAGWWEARNAGKDIHFVEVTPECEFIRAI